MADTPIDDRKFTDEEVREILSRAVQKRPSPAGGKGEGLSLAELKIIGEEVGIDPGRLEDAARAVVETDDNRPNALLGAPRILNFTRTVRGEFDPDDTPRILSVIRAATGHRGEVEEIRGSLEWGGTTEVVDRHITITSRDGSTTIHASANLAGAAILTYVPPTLIGAIVSFIGLTEFVRDGSIIGLILCLCILPILYPTLRTVLSRTSSSEADRLQRVVDELARLIESVD